jgi:alkylhydroperoxidase/carboxymuconolactone decarboxylase family protein YurZ
MAGLSSSFHQNLPREHTFFRARELATVSALANMTGTEGQLGYHLGAAMNTGLTKEQMTAIVQVLEAKVGKAPGQLMKNILNAE